MADFPGTRRTSAVFGSLQDMSNGSADPQSTPQQLIARMPQVLVVRDIRDPSRNRHPAHAAAFLAQATVHSRRHLVQVRLRTMMTRTLQEVTMHSKQRYNVHSRETDKRRASEQQLELAS